MDSARENKQAHENTEFVYSRKFLSAIYEIKVVLTNAVSVGIINLSYVLVCKTEGEI